MTSLDIYNVHKLTLYQLGMIVNKCIQMKQNFDSHDTKKKAVMKEKNDGNGEKR